MQDNKFSGNSMPGGEGDFEKVKIDILREDGVKFINRTYEDVKGDINKLSVANISVDRLQELIESEFTEKVKNTIKFSIRDQQWSSAVEIKVAKAVEYLEELAETKREELLKLIVDKKDVTED